MVAGRGAQFLKENLQLGRVWRQFLRHICKVEKIVDAKIFRNASYKFLFNAQNEFWMQKMLAEIHFKKVEL